ncbi:hypothetical protein A3F64_01705 [Candidatus Saccharibacteria bacterium RIFCSPHIGHO2_12_FULL_42_8]|nr:MAG: hypothetical protein A3F64_01705 [Candidatus Saccharibacteria bacterium RIFCSPHIGHO2_12_FULL_42_8]
MNTLLEQIRETFPVARPVDNIDTVAYCGLVEHLREFEFRETAEEFIEQEKLLARDLGTYEGKWVSVKDHVVVAFAEEFGDLVEQNKELHGYMFKVLPADTILIY